MNSVADLPPLVRDILSNVEVAFAEGAAERKNRHNEKDKGKGVAEGEKQAKPSPAPIATPVSETPTLAESSPTPAPIATSIPETPSPAESDSSTSSLETLNHISTDLSALQADFTFPSRLAFSTASTDSIAAPLLFNRVNSPYHAQANKLLQLLLQADSVSSGGDKEVRKRRKEVVTHVEGAIEDLEKKRDELWLEVREKREKGEVETFEDAHSSGSSTVDVEEHHAETDLIPSTPAEPTVEAESVETTIQQSEVPVPTVADVTEAEITQPSEEKETESHDEEAVEEHTEETEKHDDKEEGYELV